MLDTINQVVFTLIPNSFCTWIPAWQLTSIGYAFFALDYGHYGSISLCQGRISLHRIVLCAAIYTHNWICLIFLLPPLQFGGYCRCVVCFCSGKKIQKTMCRNITSLAHSLCSCLTHACFWSQSEFLFLNLIDFLGVSFLCNSK